jgi:hypothetical protein
MSQENQVTIVADDNGNVIRQSKNNPDYGFVRVTQDAVTFGPNGWVNKKSRSALILGKMEDLVDIGLDKMATLPGKIVVKESTEPFSATDPDRDLKIAGSTGIICCTADGEPIYRTSFYDASGLQQDSLIPHANGDAIREANGNAPKAEPVKSEPNAKAEEAEIEENDEVTNDVETEEETFEL